MYIINISQDHTNDLTIKQFIVFKNKNENECEENNNFT